MKFAVILATRGRPLQAQTVINAVQMMQSGAHAVEYIVACDDDDRETCAHAFDPEVKMNIAPRPTGVGMLWNRCIPLTDAEVILALPDDGLIATPNWDEAAAEYFDSIDPRLGVMAWNDTAGGGATIIMAHRKWIELAGFFDERFPFWFADTAIAEIYSFATGHHLPMPEQFRICTRPGNSNPRLRDMDLWWTVYGKARQERLRVAETIRAELGLRKPDIRGIARQWEDRDRQGLPLSQEIVRQLANPKPPEETYWRARAAAARYMRDGQTVCLCMIVKNEASIIKRCLASVMGVVDSWVIVDTGSTDGTQDVIREYLKDIPGVLHERPWVDFAHNRSEALELARPMGDYSLIIDADDVLEVPEGYWLPKLTHGDYEVDIHYGAIIYRRSQIISNALPWRYRGVLHEFLDCSGAHASKGHVPLVMRVTRDGDRAKTLDRYARDAEILEVALLTETEDFMRARYTFYLAQSHKDCGQKREALARYLERASQGHWQEEVYISLLHAGRLKIELGDPEEEVIDTFNAATEAVPSRAEALHDLSRYLRLRPRYEEAYQCAWRGARLPLPASGLFLEPAIYAYALLDELSLSAYYTGRFQESLEACERMRGVHPDQERVEINAEWARKRLA